MADDVGNGVCFARAGRALNDDAIIALQLLDDGHLLVVVRHGKVQLTRVVGPVAGRQPSKWDFRAPAHGVVARGHEALDDAWHRGGYFQLLLQAPNVLQENIARAFATKNDPAASNQQLIRGGGQAGPILGFNVSAGGVQVSHSRPQRGLKGAGIKRGQPAGAGFDDFFPEGLQLVDTGNFHLRVAVDLQFGLNVSRPDLQVKRQLVEVDAASLNQ